MNQYDPYNRTPDGQPYSGADAGQTQQSPQSYQAAYGAQAPAAQPTQQAAEPAHAAPAAATATVPGATAQHAQAAPVVITEKKSSASGGKTFLIAFAGALVACLLAFGVMSAVNGFSGGSSNSVTLGATEVATVEGSDVESTLAEAVANNCLPSVVSINVFDTASSGTGNSLYDYFYGYGDQGSDGSLAQSGVGSGVILSEDGYIITNYHVVSGGTQYEVVIEGETYKAELVGGDESSDVAVLKADGSGFTPIAIGDSDNIRIGEWVMSIGSPFGLEQSVATGIVSATSRSQIMDSSTDPYGISSGVPVLYPNLIQTDAAINPGNSGGALVDAEGKLIGINTLITSYSGNYSGVGFAIPVNYAVNIAQELIAGNEPSYAQLGVSLTTVNTQMASRYGLAVTSGAFVSSIVDGSPAAEAGIQVGDVITQFDGTKITSASDLMLQVRTKQPGDEVTLQVNRDGQDTDINVTLGSSAASSSSQEAPAQPQNSQNQQNQNNSGSPLDGLFGNLGRN